MSRQGNSNIFVGDRAYQTTFFLNFKSAKSEQKFQQETFLRTKSFLHGYIISSILYLVWNFFNSSCFDFSHGCKHTNLLIFSLFSLIAAFPVLKTNRVMLLRLLFIAPSIYIQLVLINTYSYYLFVLLIVMHTSFTSALLFQAWRPQLVSNLIAYISLAMTIRFYDIGFLVGGSAYLFLQDLLLYHVISFALSSYIEKGRRERWVLLETFKKSERIFISLVEKFQLPVFVVSNNNQVLYANGHALKIFEKYVKNLNRKVPLHKMNVSFSSLLTPQSQKSLSKLISECTFNKESQSKIVFNEMSSEDPHGQPEKSNPGSAWSTLCGTKLEELLQSSNNIYQATCTKILWKNSYENLVYIQNITKTLQVQEVMSTNLSRIIDEVRGYIESVEQNLENISAATMQNNNSKPLTQAVANMDRLRYALLNTSTTYEMACGKLKLEFDTFNVREYLVYLLEVLSVKTLKQKTEIELTFDAGFPDKVTGDYLKFTQLFHNFLNGIADNCQDGKIKIGCLMKSLLSQEQYLLGFEVEFPKNEVLQFEKVKQLLEEEYQEETVSQILKKEGELESKFFLFTPLLSILKGKSETIENESTLLVKFEIPLGSNPPSPSLKSHRQLPQIPALEKFNLTGTRMMGTAKANQFIWNNQPIPLPSPASKLDVLNSPCLSAQSMISEKIKSRFPDSSSAQSKQLSSFANPKNQQPRFAEFQRQKQLRQSLIRMSEENLSDFASNRMSIISNASEISEHMKKDNFSLDREENPDFIPRINSRQRSQTTLILMEEEKKSEVQPNFSAARRSSRLQTEKVIMNFLSSPTNHDNSGLVKTNPTTDPFTHVPDASFLSSQVDHASQSPMAAGHQSVEEPKHSYRESKFRTGSCQLEQNESAPEPHHQRSQTAMIPPNTVEVRPRKHNSTSFFTPRLSKKSGKVLPINLLAKYTNSNRRITSSEIDYSNRETNQSTLKSYKSLLRIAIGNILLEMLTIYDKKSHQTRTLNVSHLDLDKPSVIEELEESLSPSRDETQIREEKGTGSFNSVPSDNKGEEIRDLIKDSAIDGKLDGEKLVQNVLNYISNNLATKSENEFGVFLTGYVKGLEKSLYQCDLNVEVSQSLFEEEEDHFEKLIKDKRKKFKRFGSGESIMTMSSDMSMGDKGINLDERILMSPAVMKVVKLKYNPTKSFNKSGEGKVFLSGRGERTEGGEGQRRGIRKMTLDIDDKQFKRKEHQTKLLPFGKSIEYLPLFMACRLETNRRRWIGKPKTVENEVSKKKFNFLDVFTILAVDDSDFVLNALKAIETPYEIHFEFAKDGFEAFNKFQHYSNQGQLYHFIFIDLMMPKCDGKQATKLIRDFEAKNECPKSHICGLSAVENPETRKQCIESGMNDFCSKPLNAGKLIDFIKARCEELNIDINTLQK